MGATTDHTTQLELSSVEKRFGYRQVLSGVNLQVKKGEVVALIGSSGSGKSTLLKAVNLLIPVDQGSIHWEGREITDPRINPNQVRRTMGIVFQSFNLFPHMKVLDNITLSPIKVHGFKREQAQQRAEELLSRFGLSDKSSQYPDRLSGGEQQRVAIVRALATQPRLMLLDEVTSALDPELVAEVLDVIRGLKKEGMTMLIATHEMEFAREVANRVCFLDQGEIREQGPPDQIFTNPTHPRTRQFLQRIIAAGRFRPET